jgi:hypothetical protein
MLGTALAAGMVKSIAQSLVARQGEIIPMPSEEKRVLAG